MPVKFKIKGLKFKAAALCGALLLLAAGCRSHREAARTTLPEQAATSQQDTVQQAPTVPIRPAAPRFRTATFTCSVSGTQASGQLRLMSDSLIWASASKIIELGRAELTRDSVLVYSRAVSRCFRGSYEDVYRRFHYRTSFDELQTLLLSSDADQQLAAILKQLRIDAAIHVGTWKEVPALTFPFSIPANARPL